MKAVVTEWRWHDNIDWRYIFTTGDNYKFFACGEHLGILNGTPMSLYNNAHSYTFLMLVRARVRVCVCQFLQKSYFRDGKCSCFVDINFYFLHFAGTNFREWLIFLHFAGINFREWPFFLHFAGTNFRELKAIRESLFPRKFIPRKFIPRKFITLR